MDSSLKDIEALMEKRASMIDSKLNALAYAIEPMSLSEVVRYALSLKGKRIRTTVLTLSCEAAGGEMEKAIAPAMAVEMLHNTSLVLDDIIDKSDIRRGKATINNRWGNEMALIACDVMLSLAIREITRSDLGLTKQMIDCVADSMLRLAEGEALELEKKKFTIDDYYKIADKKTASLFSASAESGALVGNAEEKYVKALHQYGRSLGMAFQARDDILDFTVTEQIGKTAFLDLKMNRPTLVMILAANDGLSREEMLGMDRDVLLGRLKPFIEEAEIISRAKAEEAKRYLDIIPQSLARDRLEILCEYVASRKK
jgi:geranylgeranyl diphosphate synthase type I